MSLSKISPVVGRGMMGAEGFKSVPQAVELCPTCCDHTLVLGGHTIWCLKQICPRQILCAGDELVIEEFLDGEEASFFALVNGEECVPLIAAQVGWGGRREGS